MKMSVKWTGNQSETGILRKSECKEKKEELFVFGYTCKLFRDDDKALQVDQGKHLIPWMGDETLKIDRYDARGALHDLSALEAPPGGFDWRVELTRTELGVELLCDEERYRALHTDEDEEEMYKEEELKRLHAAGYGQVGFNYDAPAESKPEAPVEIEEPFVPSQTLKDLLPTNTVFPDTLKQNAIIEKTANFIAHQGTQMEILIKAKQQDNPQFMFLNKDCSLHGYYTALTALVKAGKWPEKKIEVVEEKQQEINEEYLHPSLAATIIESAPSIPSIHYKPSADCDYTLLISKMRGEATLDEAYATELAPGEVAPPGTEPLPPRANAEISRAPVMYNKDNQVRPAVQQQYATLYQQYMAQPQTQVNPQPNVPGTNTPPLKIEKPIVTKSTGLSLMKNYNTDSDSDVSDFDDSSSSDSKDKPIIISPPDDVKTVIDKMAAYVARNGDEFEEIVRSKNDPRFTFLETDNLYHPFYKKLMQEKRGVDVNGKDKDQLVRDKTPVVSFSIKKLKEPDPILPKPALPYESSEDEDKQVEANEETKEMPKTNLPPIQTTNNIPAVLVYKMEVGQIHNLPVIKTIEQRVSNKTARAIILPETKEQVAEPIQELPKIEENTEKEEIKMPEKPPEKKEEKNRDREKKNPSLRKHAERKKEYRSKEYRERRSEKRSAEKEKDRERQRERKREKESEKKKHKYKDELESEIISLEDNSDEMIDLTGDQSDSKGEYETEADKTKQQERRKRAAEFLKKVGVDPSAAALPTTSLASAMVDTLESLRKKRNEQEEKRRRHEKRRRKEKREYEGESDKHRKNKRKKNRSSEEEDSDFESSKKKKRKKDKKPSKNKKKRKREIELQEEPPQQINIDLTNTLKELRTLSPIKELGLHGIDDLPTLALQESSSEEEVEKQKKKRDREYSEGEWSSDSDEDSVSSVDKELK